MLCICVTNNCCNQSIWTFPMELMFNWQKSHQCHNCCHQLIRSFLKELLFTWHIRHLSYKQLLQSTNLVGLVTWPLEIDHHFDGNSTSRTAVETRQMPTWDTGPQKSIKRKCWGSGKEWLSSKEKWQSSGVRKSSTDAPDVQRISPIHQKKSWSGMEFVRNCNFILIRLLFLYKVSSKKQNHKQKLHKYAFVI